MHCGLNSFLKSFASGATPKASSETGGSAATPKATAKPKSTPKAHARAAAAKTRAVAGPKTTPKAEIVDKKTSIGNADGVAGGSSKRQRAAQSDPFADSPVGKKGRNTADDSITEADQATIDAFAAKIDPLKVISPPVSDGPFKAYLADRSTAMSQVVNELRVKKKSAERRSGCKSNYKPDMLFLQRLAEFETEVKDMHKLIRCILVICSAYVCSFVF